MTHQLTPIVILFANSSTLDVGFWDSPLGDNGPNIDTFKLYELSNSESTITVTPTETTEYWVDVTTMT